MTDSLDLNVLIRYESLLVYGENSFSLDFIFNTLKVVYLFVPLSLSLSLYTRGVMIKQREFSNFEDLESAIVKLSF